MQNGPRIRDVIARFIGPMRRHVNVARPAGGATLVRGAQEAVDLIIADNRALQAVDGVRTVARIDWRNCPPGFRAPDPHRLGSHAPATTKG